MAWNQKENDIICEIFSPAHCVRDSWHSAAKAGAQVRCTAESWPRAALADMCGHI